MAQQKIYLRKIRDFGENLGDTFQYLRQEFRPLIGSFVLIAGIFIVAAAVISGLFQTQISTIFEDMSENEEIAVEIAGTFFGRYLIIIVFAMMAMAAMQTTIACYMKLYDLHGVSPRLEEVWNEFKRYYPKMLVLAILKLLIYIPAFALCILPGVYMLVVFAPMTWVVVNEDSSISDAFRRCFELIREQFWLSLGIYVVAYLIYSFASGILGTVLGIFVGISSYLSTREVESSFGIVTSVSTLISYLFYVVFAVSVGLQYYNLTEHREGVGMMRRLDELGSSNQHNQTEEQY